MKNQGLAHSFMSAKRHRHPEKAGLSACGSGTYRAGDPATRHLRQQ